MCPFLAFFAFDHGLPIIKVDATRTRHDGTFTLMRGQIGIVRCSDSRISATIIDPCHITPSLILTLSISHITVSSIFTTTSPTFNTLSSPLNDLRPFTLFPNNITPETPPWKPLPHFLLHGPAARLGRFRSSFPFSLPYLTKLRHLSFNWTPLRCLEGGVRGVRG